MASASLANPARQPWFGVVYDALCRKEWSERSGQNDPLFDVNQVILVSCSTECLASVTYLFCEGFAGAQ